MPNYYRVYTGPDGQSHIEKRQMAFADFVDVEGAHGKGTPLEAARGLTFRISPPGYFLDFHCAPRKQYTITLSGQAEIGLGDGSMHYLYPGDVLLAEDTTGKGHTTRVVGTEERHYIVAHME